MKLQESLATQALRVAIAYLPYEYIIDQLVDKNKNQIDWLCKDDLVNQLTIDIEQYQLDKKRQNHTQLLAEKHINYCKALLPTE